MPGGDEEKFGRIESQSSLRTLVTARKTAARRKKFERINRAGCEGSRSNAPPRRAALEISGRTSALGFLLSDGNSDR